jgi:hypothetical protein
MEFRGLFHGNRRDPSARSRAVRRGWFASHVLNAQEHGSSSSEAFVAQRHRSDAGDSPPHRRWRTTLAILCALAAIPAADASQQGAPGQSAPVLITTPSITGTYRERQTLTANEGTWNGPDRDYALQWLRCGNTGSLCSPLVGATGDQYVLTGPDVGSTLRISVTATNKNGSTVGTSAATPVIAPALSTYSVTSTTTPTSTTTTTTSSSTTTTTTPTSTAPWSVSSRWYSATSAWNTPIPANVPVHPNNANFISAMQNTYCTGSGCIAPIDHYSTPSVWIANNSTPLVTVQINFPNGCNSSRVQVPIPAGAVASHAGDPEPVMTVMQADTGEEWDFFKVTPPGVSPVSYNNCPANSLWQAIIAAHHNPGWTGMGSATSTRASGTLLGTGTIRPRDWQMPTGSTWDHALGFAYEGTTAGYVYPAISGSGAACRNTSSCIPMGARFQLDPSVNCSTWPSLQSEFVRQMCRTLQKYGMIAVDSGSGLVAENSVSAQSTIASADGPHTGQTAPWNIYPYIQYLPQDLVAKLRVIDWTKWTG